MKYTVEKPGFDFKFDVFEEEGKLKIKCQLVGIEEKDFFAKELNREKSAIVFWVEREINGKKIGGMLIPNEIVDEIAKFEDTIKLEQKERVEDQKRKLREGDEMITVHWHDGEYLSDFEVSGYGAELLEKLGLAKYISGWGTKVNNELVKTLGKSFTYPQAVEYAKPIQEARDKKEAVYNAQLEERFSEAKSTGKPVVLRSYHEDCDDSGEDCDVDILTVYAMPDGTKKTIRTHTW